MVGSILSLAQWVKDPELLWLWLRPVATAPIRPLAWEPPYAAEAAQEIATTTTTTKKTKKQTNKQRSEPWNSRCGTVVNNPTRSHEVAGLIPDLAQWIKDLALP